MGFYSEQREDFARRFGFFPNRESGYLDLFINKGKDSEELKEKLENDFFAIKSKDFISKLRRDFLNEFGREITNNDELYEYYLYQRNSDYFFRSLIIPFNEFYEDERFGFFANGYTYFEKDNRDLVVFFYKNPIILEEVKRGIYKDGIERKVFSITNNHLVKCNIDWRFGSEFHDIKLPYISNSIIIDTIDDYCFSKLDDDYASVIIPKTYIHFSPKAFTIMDWRVNKQIKKVTLEDKNVINSSNYASFYNTNVWEEIKNDYRSSINVLCKMNNCEMFIYDACFEDYEIFFHSWINDKTSFEKNFKLLVDCLKLGYLKKGYLCKNEYNLFVKLLGNSLKNYDSFLYSLFTKECSKILHLQYQKSTPKLLTYENLAWTKESSVNIELLVIPDYFVLDDYLCNDILHDGHIHNIEVVNAFENIEKKIVGLYGTKYYTDYRKKFMKNHTKEEWKVFVSPRAIKSKVIKNPAINKHVLADEHYSWSDGVSNVWDSWTVDYYEWVDNEGYWYHYYSSDRW